MAETFPISGNIDPSTFPFLLADLHRQGATGSLKVEGPSYPKALYFRGGRVLFGSSNDPKDQLGSILIESGKINQAQLDDVNTKVGPGNPLAKVLAESGYVNQRELSDAARVKVERILSDVLSYTSGSFEFEDGVLPKGAVDLKLSTEKLVLAAVARLTDRSFVLRHLESLGVVLAPTAEMSERIADLRPESGELPERFDGQRSLKDAAALTRLDEFEAAKIACALLFLGLLRKAETSASTASAGEEVDLAQTARMAFDPTGKAPEAEAEAEPPFFVPEAATDETEALDITMPDTPRPRFPDTETPALGMNVPGLPTPFSPASLLQPEPEPEADSVPTIVGFSMPEEEPGGFALSEPPEPPIPRMNLASAPPNTEALDRLPAPPPPAPAPAPTPPPQSAPPPPSKPPDFSLPAVLPPPPLAFEEEPAREPVAPARPSKEDLAALDALLNPSASMRSTSVPTARPKAERWEPQFRSGPAPVPAGPRANRRPRSSFPVVPLAVGGGLLLALAGGAWYYFNRPAPPPRPVVRATPPPPSSITVPPSASPTTLPADPVPTGAPSTAPTSEPSSPPPPVTAPTATPTAATVPGPKTPPKVAAGPGDLGEARQLLERRDYAAAARGFASSVRSNPDARWSVQLLVACSEETVGKALANASGPDLLILPVNYKGKSCYRLCWGLYDSEGRATAAMGAVPAYFREGGAKPKVSPTASLLP